MPWWKTHLDVNRLKKYDSNKRKGHDLFRRKQENNSSRTQYTPTKRNSVGYPCCTLCPTKKGESSTNPKLIPENVHFLSVFLFFLVQIGRFSTPSGGDLGTRTGRVPQKTTWQVSKEQFDGKKQRLLKKAFGKTRVGTVIYHIHVYI